MSTIIDMVDAFWAWTGYAEKYRGTDISRLPIDPFEFPLLPEMQQVCVGYINKSLSEEEVDAFLMCMAVDNECEYVLDKCKSCADIPFLTQIISAGIKHTQPEARWQIAELLRKNIPERSAFLKKLLSDEDSYVRKRARNVTSEIK